MKRISSISVVFENEEDRQNQEKEIYQHLVNCQKDLYPDSFIPESYTRVGNRNYLGYFIDPHNSEWMMRIREWEKSSNPSVVYIEDIVRPKNSTYRLLVFNCLGDLLEFLSMFEEELIILTNALNGECIIEN